MDVIFHCIINGMADKLREILSREETDPNSFQQDGLSPLHVAAMSEYPECLELLLKHVRYTYSINEIKHLHSTIFKLKLLIVRGIHRCIWPPALTT